MNNFKPKFKTADSGGAQLFRIWITLRLDIYLFTYKTTCYKFITKITRLHAVWHRCIQLRM